MKRIDYISWDEFFMGIAIVASKRSKDPNTQVGSCIVNIDNKIIGIGYNGMPNGCCDDILPWDKEADPHKSKYAYVVHSEVNAIINCLSSKELKGSILYCTLFPCNECSKIIIQSGIKKVIFLEDKYSGDDYNIIAKKMLSLSGVIYEEFQTKRENINLVLKK